MNIVKQESTSSKLSSGLNNSTFPPDHAITNKQYNGEGHKNNFREQFLSIVKSLQPIHRGRFSEPYPKRSGEDPRAEACAAFGNKKNWLQNMIIPSSSRKKNKIEASESSMW